MDRDIIIQRWSNSDEKGFFFAIPVGELYNFFDKNDKLELHIEGRDIKDNIPIRFYTCLDKVSMYFITNTGLENKISLFYTCSISQFEKTLTFILNIKYNFNNNMLEFYDGYYDTLYSIKKYHHSYNMEDTFLAPFILSTIRGNITNDIIESQIDISNMKFTIDIVTQKIQEIIFSKDIMYKDTFGLYYQNNADRLKELNVTKVNQFILKNYYYDFQNNKIFLLDDTKANELQLFIYRTKSLISESRQLQTDIFHSVIDEKDYIKVAAALKKDIEERQKFLKIMRDNDYKSMIDYYKVNNNCKYYVSLCLLIKDENEYLKEWLDNHYNIGVEHFYIYDNGSKITVQSTIDEYKNGFYKDKCTVIDFSQKCKHMQYKAYNDCLSNFGKDSYWIGFIDTDELIKFENNENNIIDFLKNYENDFALWIPWKVYNANGTIKKEEGTMEERFNQIVIDPIGFYGKVFVQSFRTQRMYVHYVQGRNDEFDHVVDANHKLHTKTFINKLNKYYNGEHEDLYPEVWINHYVTRSYEEWCEKMSRGSCDPNFRKKFNEFFAYNPEMSYLKDRPEVQELLGTEQPYENNNS